MAKEKSADDIIKVIKDEKVEYVDIRFCDLPGVVQHFSIPASAFDESVFTDGLAFDGSSVRGFQSIHESDMMLLPDPETARLDPFRAAKTLNLNFFVHDPFTREPYSRVPRNVARKAENYLTSTGIADTCFIGPEAEFFIFDDDQYDVKPNGCFYSVDSEEAAWNTGRDEMPKLGYKVRHKEGYFPVAPADTQQDIRSEMAIVMEQLGLKIERQHHEVATAGQAEIDYRFSPLLSAADQMMVYKYVVRNVAKKYGKTACFMPKPLFGDNGSGMHTHQSLWKKGKPLFAGNEYAGLSQMALYYIGGLLKHAKALCAICNPTTNSYKRLVPGYEAPVNLAYSARNRSAAIRIPTFSESPKAKRIEYRPPDPAANPYVAFAALLMAGLDGIQNKIDPGEPLDKNIYELPPEELKKVPNVAGSLGEALDCLEQDHEFLLKGDVFTSDFIEMWISHKRKEVDALRLRPHPMEFFLYYDA